MLFQVMSIVEMAILSTDLASYFEKRERFLVVADAGEFDWQVNNNNNLYRYTELPHLCPAWSGIDLIRENSCRIGLRLLNGFKYILYGPDPVKKILVWIPTFRKIRIFRSDQTKMIRSHPYPITNR